MRSKDPESRLICATPNSKDSGCGSCKEEKQNEREKRNDCQEWKKQEEARK